MTKAERIEVARCSAKCLNSRDMDEMNRRKNRNPEILNFREKKINERREKINYVE